MSMAEVVQYAMAVTSHDHVRDDTVERGSAEWRIEPGRQVE
jgi:hypothetical protein